MNLEKKATELHNLGFWVTPTTAEKEAREKEWTAVRCTNMTKFAHSAGIGAVLGKEREGLYLHCVDIDCEDPEISKALRQFIIDMVGGVFPYRIGRAPRFGVPIWMESPFKKKHSKKYGPSHIEFLGDGQQFVAYGKHPTAGKYTWYEGDLTSELPKMTMVQVDMIIAEFERLSEAAGHEPTENKVPKLSLVPGSSDVSDLDRAVNSRPIDLTPAEVLEYLEQYPAQELDRDEWLEVGMALHHQGMDYEVWRDWARGYSENNDAHNWTAWNSFDDNKDSFKTFATIVAKVKKIASLTTTAPSLAGYLNPTQGGRLGAGSSLNWLVEGIIEENTIGQIFAAPGTGKSFLALDLAAHMAAGEPWAGRWVKAGPVVYLAGEGEGGLNRRIAAIEQAKTLDTSNLITGKMPNFGDAGQLSTLRSNIDALDTPPVLIVVDTLARAALGLEENSAKEMGPVVENMAALAKEYGCTVLAVHHTAKGVKAEARGSGALKGAMDFEIRLETNNDGVVKVSCAKSKDSEPFGDMAFRLDSVQLPENHSDNLGNRIGSAVVDWIPASDFVEKSKLNDNEILVLRAYDSVFEDISARVPTPSTILKEYGLGSPADSIPVDRVRNYWERGQGGEKRTTVSMRWKRTLEKLVVKNRIRVIDDIFVKLVA